MTFRCSRVLESTSRKFNFSPSFIKTFFQSPVSRSLLRNFSQFTTTTSLRTILSRPPVNSSSTSDTLGAPPNTCSKLCLLCKCNSPLPILTHTKHKSVSGSSLIISSINLAVINVFPLPRSEDHTSELQSQFHLV